jgi:hypothetical protein
VRQARAGTLRERRLRKTSFDPCFFEKSPLFWPIAPAARTFANCTDWPDVASLSRAFRGDAPVSFEIASPRPRRRRRKGPIDPRSLYDARITEDARVPTRPRSWHDYLNALVWATFPRSKLALHARQLRALAPRIDPGSTRLPSTRTREHDALALLDEGGVVRLVAPTCEIDVIFGHALYEGLVLGVRAMIARAIVAEVEHVPRGGEARAAAADLALSTFLRDAPLAPEALPRVTLPCS